ncbi:MAG: glycoside hydrolase family 43 protein [Hyphomonadaceae bacterium]|nr:glycoside hydrolase family 43 protein [Hyphomonadaceae bacterium]
MLLAACAPSTSPSAPDENRAEADTPAPLTMRVNWFEYEGRDSVFEALTASPDQYLNPVLSGFYPDPSITQVGGDYYLVNSTFCYFPGIPVFHSTDLVNWTQIGNVIDRDGMLDFDGLSLSRGVFAPTIEHHDGVFYVANTCVDCGGNFIVTSSDPAGPWSDPIWLPEVGGIDPSVFFDADGKVYVINNDAPPEGSTYDGHRAIWIREVDPETFQSISTPSVLLNGGVRPEQQPIWIEGPHIYKVGDWYYLSAAEGGTAINHSQVVLRARSVTGPYEPYEDNPILTQRHIDPDRADPITSVGHADFVTDDAGNWWVTFLGVRPYEGDHYNTGRETYLMPVRWENGWPMIAKGQEQVPYLVSGRPELPDSGPASVPMSGNFTLREEFDGATLPFHWMSLRVPKTQWYELNNGALELQARPVSLGSGQQPSFLGRRQQHLDAVASMELEFTPLKAGDEAGLAVLQSDNYYYRIGVRMPDTGIPEIQVRVRAGGDAPEDGEALAFAPLGADFGGTVELRITARRDLYDFEYRLPNGTWTMMASDQDGKLLSTRVATGFVGATFGPYAQRAGEGG